MERTVGIGPTSLAWKASALPLCYARVKLELKKGLEPSTGSLQNYCSTIELFQQALSQYYRLSHVWVVNLYFILILKRNFYSHHQKRNNLQTTPPLP